MLTLPSYQSPAEEVGNRLAVPRLRVRTYTFGCKVNRSDTSAIENSLLWRPGVSLVGETEAPDVVIVNTCTVTSSADRQARQLLRRLHREHPEARIVVTGCYAETEAEKLSEINGVTDIVPLRQQEKIPALIGFSELVDQSSRSADDQLAGRTRALLKLQDGCNAYCSFCILPYIRGRSRSLPLEGIIEQARGFERSGYREIVVTGTHIAGYGRDLNPRTRLSDALKSIAQAIPRTPIRVSSLEPAGVTADFVRAIKENPQFRPHFHIPLQSGSDNVLQRMNRKYRVRNYAERIESLAAARTDVGIGTDVIVGFPGETDADFESTERLLRDLPITFLHVFRFSARPGTRAAELADTVPDLVKYRRMRTLMDLADEKRAKFFGRFLGSVQPVLVELNRDAEGRLTGYTPHYVPVRFLGPDRLMRRDVDVRLTSLDRGAVCGEAV